MRGYHIRIVVQPSPEPSTSQIKQEDYFVPNRIFERLPVHNPLPTARRNALFNPQNKDYRFGPIRIDWIDFERMNKAASTSVRKGKEQGPAKATFIPHTESKSGSTNLPEGVVHVFRDSADIATSKEDTGASGGLSSENGVILGVLAVPSWMAPSDFLRFVAPASEGISHLRIIRDSAPDRSIVLIEFPKPEDAAEFIEAYNGKPFNALESEICNVVHVMSVKVSTDDAAYKAFAPVKDNSMYELPTCPVCLERMDSAVTGLITVPCSHTFHCACLSKWGDSRCPVCRYSQNLKSSHPSSSSNRSSVQIPFSETTTSSLSRCSSCSSPNNLWICLICGNVGCGRYGRAHAYEHYQFTTHLYALELETQRVWDYAGDGYVHRLIQNRADGKLVELPNAASSMGTSSRDGGAGPSAADALSAEKIEAIGIEYSYLLTSQLDSQRAYYEEQTAELHTEVEELRRMVEMMTRDSENERKRAADEAEERKREEETRTESLAKDRTKAESKAEKMVLMARQLDKELKEERAVSEGLMKNLAKMKERGEAWEAEKKANAEKIQELEEQLRDVMFFLEANARIEQGGGPAAEAAGGSVEIPPLPPSSTKKKKSRKT